jgi:hypothetical protein
MGMLVQSIGCDSEAGLEHRLPGCLRAPIPGDIAAGDLECLAGEAQCSVEDRSADNGIGTCDEQESTSFPSVSSFSALQTVVGRAGGCAHQIEDRQLTHLQLAVPLREAPTGRSKQLRGPW